MCGCLMSQGRLGIVACQACKLFCNGFVFTDEACSGFPFVFLGKRKRHDVPLPPPLPLCTCSAAPCRVLASGHALPDIPLHEAFAWSCTTYCWNAADIMGKGGQNIPPIVLSMLVSQRHDYKTQRFTEQGTLCCRRGQQASWRHKSRTWERI